MFRNSSYWRQQRHEIIGGIGVSNFLGELGGRDQIGSKFIYDLEFSETKYSLSAAHRYYVLQNISLKSSLSLAEVGGDDKLTNEPFRNNRNLHFTATIIELATQAEFHLTQETSGHRYKIRGAHGAKARAFGIYGFAGIGLFYFNPQAYVENVGWVDLQPLGTEGQLLEGGTGPYSLFSVCIPMGFGLRTAAHKDIRIGFEFGFRKTFTDYIDDVSTVYADKTALAQQNNSGFAVPLSDPSLGIYYGQSATGQQRGDAAEMDSYMFAQATIAYKISANSRKRYGKYRKRSKRLGGRSKKRRSMASF